MSEVVQVPVASSTVPCVEADGELYVVFRPAVEALGINYDSAANRLRRSSWATNVMMTLVAADGKPRQMLTTSIDAWIMFLATIDESRVAEHLRPLVVEFQKESGRALRDYWLKGVALNHRATEEQLKAHIRELDSLVKMHEISAEGEEARGRKQFLNGVRAGRNNPDLDYHAIYEGRFVKWEQADVDEDVLL